MLKPYRDGGPAVNAWDIGGLKTAVLIDGTLNQPGDKDSGWSIEIAFPWEVLKECAHKQTPPRDGDQWRVNFSRVEWRTDIEDGRYVKKTDTATGRALSEDNWVWSPQGLVAMHYPEMWGLVQFSERTAGDGEWVEFESESKENYMQYGRYTEDITRLGISPDMKPDGYRWPPEIHITPNQFEASLEYTKDKHKLHIDQSGHVWQD